MKDRSCKMPELARRRRDESHEDDGHDFDWDDLSTRRLLLMSLLSPSSLKTTDLQLLAGAAVSLFEVEAKRCIAQVQPMPNAARIRMLHS